MHPRLNYLLAAVLALNVNSNNEKNVYSTQVQLNTVYNPISATSTLPTIPVKTKPAKPTPSTGYKTGKKPKSNPKQLNPPKSKTIGKKTTNVPKSAGYKSTSPTKTNKLTSTSTNAYPKSKPKAKSPKNLPPKSTSTVDYILSTSNSGMSVSTQGTTVIPSIVPVTKDIVKPLLPATTLYQISSQPTQQLIDQVSVLPILPDVPNTVAVPQVSSQPQSIQPIVEMSYQPTIASVVPTSVVLPLSENTIITIDYKTLTQLLPVLTDITVPTTQSTINQPSPTDYVIPVIQVLSSSTSPETISDSLPTSKPLVLITTTSSTQSSSSPVPLYASSQPASNSAPTQTTTNAALPITGTTLVTVSSDYGASKTSLLPVITETTQPQSAVQTQKPDGLPGYMFSSDNSQSNVASEIKNPGLPGYFYSDSGNEKTENVNLMALVNGNVPGPKDRFGNDLQSQVVLSGAKDILTSFLTVLTIWIVFSINF
ncbi:hypothetical protein HDV02_003202 [Globomyces sp. JEL0801]|nr:hypothetical protein HDV02_003202 [Globomyces sp. JEL0801]